MSDANEARIATCPCCGLAQRVPPHGPRERAVCLRCRTSLSRGHHRAPQRAAAFAAGALVLYPLAMLLPVMTIEQFGHASTSSIIAGIGTLFTTGQWLIGIIVFLCSVVIPLTKLVALLVLAGGARSLGDEHRALTYHLLEWTGRWGMLDVLLVAMLVAALKLGDIVTVTPGPGVIAFAAVVGMSLIASTCFDPHHLWERQPPSAIEEPGAGASA